jgi:hypothetical protein
MVGRENFIGPHLVYTITHGREMSNVIKVSDEEQFAKGQNSRDLRVCYDAGDVEVQLIEAIGSAYDFLRLLQVSMRGVAKNQPRLLTDARIGVVNARLKYLAEATPKPVYYTYDPPAGVPASQESTPSKVSLSATAVKCSANCRSTPPVSCSQITQLQSKIFMILMRLSRSTTPKSSAC